MMKMKKTQGRRKIEIKKIENMNSRQVTFCRRRTGVFNKASEVCVLTGAQIAVLVQSSGDKVYSFGHPNVDSIINNYLVGDYNLISNVGGENSSFLNQEQYENYLKITQELEYEKNMSKMSKTDTNVEESGLCWWEQCVDNLEIDELEMFIVSMEKLKDNVAKRADELTKMMMVTDFSSPNNIDLDDYRRVCSDEFQNDVTERVEESEACSNQFDQDIIDLDDHIRACLNQIKNNVTERAEESKEVTTSELSLDNVDLDDYMRACSDQFQNNVTEEAMLTTSSDFDQDDVSVWDDIWAYVDQESTDNDVSV